MKTQFHLSMNKIVVKNKISDTKIILLNCILMLSVSQVNAQNVLIKNAEVYTQSAQGVLNNSDVLVQNGRITSIGTALSAPANTATVDAKGMALTPGLFGGINALGVEEVQLEPSTVDSAFAPGAQTPALESKMRPEFLVTRAYNPNSVEIPVQRVDGITFNMVAPVSLPGGSIFSGQGEIVVLDRAGSMRESSRTLFIDLGGDTNAIAGGSRAAAWMLLEQAVSEARSNNADELQSITSSGRDVLRQYLSGGRVAFLVDRASDIKQVITWSKRNNIKPIIVGGVEAWLVANELAASQTPVLLDPLNNLPGNFDQIGARLDNAAILQRAGVLIGFLQSDDSTANARKIRQHAGNSVAHGLPKLAALAAITNNPAKIFGLENERGQIAVGQVADLVLWNGDPLELSTLAQQVWIEGKAQSMQSRQTQLRDRYLKRFGW